jgi:4-amino-4-deoxy-L-arabinose transferase-like glycosyltransferase
VVLNQGGFPADNSCLQPRNIYAFLTVSACLTVFLALGLCFIPYLGLQNDEVIFGTAIYAPRQAAAYIAIFHRALPTMLLSYLGALKAWLYAPVLAMFSPSAGAIRLPVMLMGALTIFLFSRLLERLLGRRAAVAGCALLATDTTYLLTTCFDWGPVVIQRLLAVAGVLLTVKFHQDRSPAPLGGAFFLFGLALWDKALFVWSMAGFAVGLIVVMPSAVRRYVSARNVAVAAICFLVGAYPLLRYNHRHPMGTLRGTVELHTEGIAQKALVLGSTLDGSGLLGYLTYEDATDHPRSPRNGIEQSSMALDRLDGHPVRGFLAYCILAATVAIPFLWRTPARKPALFAVIFLVVTWTLMALGRRTGASVHHTALLWPWPQFLVAVTFSELSRRFRRAGLAALVLPFSFPMRI